MDFYTGWMKVTFPIEDSYEGATIELTASRPPLEDGWQQWTEISFIAKDMLLKANYEGAIADLVADEYER